MLKKRFVKFFDVFFYFSEKLKTGFTHCSEYRLVFYAKKSAAIRFFSSLIAALIYF